MTATETHTLVRRAWVVLRSPTGDEFVSAQVVGRSSSGAPIRVGIDRASAHLFLIPLADEGRPDIPDLDGSLRVRLRDIRFAGQLAEYVSIECATVGLFDVFTELAAEILGVIEGHDTPAAAAIAELHRWRQLLRTHRRAALGPRQELGVFGELWVLHTLLDTDGPNQINWTGPTGTLHDLDVGDRWVEVKTGTLESTCVTVHGLDQLDTAESDGNLVIVRADQTDEGHTIGELVEAIELIIGAGQIDEQLASAGWSRLHNADRPWAVAECLVAAAQNVPRLTSPQIMGGVPLGLENVTYEVQIDSVRSSATIGVDAVRALAASDD